MNTLGNSISRSGLVGEWLLDGNALDTASTNNGTATNVNWVKSYKGYQSQAGNFTTNTSQILIPGNISQHLQEFTWCGYINISNNKGTILYKKNGFSAFFIAYQIYLGLDGAHIVQMNGSGYTLSQSLNGTISNGFHFVEINRTTNSWSIYIDRVLFGTISSAPTITYSTSNDYSLYIGKNPVTTAEGFYGVMQNLRFYNRILSQDEITLLYREGQRLLGPTATPKYPALLSGLVGYWDFRSTAHNLVDGVLPTVSGATLTTDRFGNSNSAYSFDGNDTISTPDNSVYNFGTGDFSVSFYDKTISSPTYGAIINKYNNTPINVGWTINHGTSNNTACYIYLWNNGVGAVYQCNPGFFEFGVYHLYTVQRKGLTVEFYRDGVLFQTLGIVSVNVSSTYPLIMGATNGGETSIIDEFKIFNRALSASEVKALYDLTSQDYIYPTPSYDLTSLRDGLVLDLNEKGLDLSGNGNNGTLVNSPAVIRQGRAKGLSYNGGNQYIDLGNVNNITGEITMSARIKHTAGGTNYERIISKLFTNLTNYAGYNFQLTDTGVIQCELTNTNGGPSATYFRNGTKNLKDGKWHLVNVTRKPTQQMILFVDGITETIGTTNGTPPASIGITTNVLSIGRLNFNGVWYYGNITIFNPKIYNRALSQAEIQQLYYKDKANFIY